jgi:Transposase DDE domain group 1
MTECNGEQLGFHRLGRRAVVGRFDSGAISSDGGAMLLSEVEAKTRIIERFAEQYGDCRNPELTEHQVWELVGPRVFALALG